MNAYDSSDSIHLASSLTIGTISKNNGGGGNHGGSGTIKSVDKDGKVLEVVYKLHIYAKAAHANTSTLVTANERVGTLALFESSLHCAVSGQFPVPGQLTSFRRATVHPLMLGFLIIKYLENESNAEKWVKRYVHIPFDILYT